MGNDPTLKDAGQNSYASFSSEKFGQSADNCRSYAQTALNNWYDQSKNYDYEKGAAKDGSSVVGGFTQLVWNSSTKIGCGLAFGPLKDGFYSYFVVCNFTPAGNVQGEEKANVLKLKAN